MQTHFTREQLKNPRNQHSEPILRACVHCGFCLPTCPTYALLGNELDSPRGRIYLIKDMLENDRPATAETALHIDRCLSCLSCVSACPSGVNYQHLIDHARAHVEETYRRPFADRALRALLAWLLPYPIRFRMALSVASFVRPLGRFMPQRLQAMLALAPALPPIKSVDEHQSVFPASGPRRARVALLPGCAQRVLAPSINAATIRLLNRHGVEVVVPRDSGCCGAIVHHIGKEAQSRALALRTMQTWESEIDSGGLDAIIVNASGCGTEVKDYHHMFRDDPAVADLAQRVSGLARDVSEYVATLGLGAPAIPSGLTVAYQSACSLQHGQGIDKEPRALLAAVGFTVRDVPEGHLCCGSAGTYNLLQPEIAGQLRDRKLANIIPLAPDVIATGNVGCMTQLAQGTSIPIVHTIELLDWATGGPVPDAIAAPGI